MTWTNDSDLLHFAISENWSRKSNLKLNAPKELLQIVVSYSRNLYLFEIYHKKRYHVSDDGKRVTGLGKLCEQGFILCSNYISSSKTHNICFEGTYKTYRMSFIFICVYCMNLTKQLL